MVGGRRAVFLDRDGVINRSIMRAGKPTPPRAEAEFELLPGVPAAIAALRAAGWFTAIVTNQPDIATGKTTAAFVDWVHARIQALAPVDAILVCACVDGPDCPCYKPKPGMLLDAAAAHGLDLARSAMVGDRWRDVGAGRAAGCQTYFIDYGYGEAMPVAPDHVVADLAAAARLILASNGVMNRASL